REAASSLPADGHRPRGWSRHRRGRALGRRDRERAEGRPRLVGGADGQAPGSAGGAPSVTAFVSLRRQLGRLVAGGMLGKGFWAVMDQGLFAFSNFLVNILLARWLAPESYGAFSIAFSLFLVLGTFHTALLTEPMLVFGASKYRYSFAEYLRVLLRGH